MKKSMTFLALTISLAGLSFFGWGCSKQSTATSDQRSVDQTQLTATSTQNTATTTEEVVAVEPKPLAYLLLTKDAKVVVRRGVDETQGVSEMELYEGDEVEVTAGEARLLYPETGMSVLQPGTKLRLIPQGQPKEGGLGLQLLLEAGKVWTRLERLLGKDESLSVDANSVVATVRGTGFGIGINDGKVNVSVADHQIEVSTSVILNVGTKVTQSVTLAAGNGLTLDPASLNKMTDLKTEMLKNIRTLTSTEKKQPEYLFGQARIAPGELKRPANPFRWSALMAWDDRLSDRLQPENVKQWLGSILWIQQHQTELRQAERVFQASTSTPVRFQIPLKEIKFIMPTTTPALRGPSS
ncbi:MAG: hypothetical protein WCW34_01200 [Patescibacteria group bacterium]|jgi:hypothetical protein